MKGPNKQFELELDTNEFNPYDFFQFLNKSGLVPGFEGKQGFLAQNRGDLLNLDIEKTDFLLGKKHGLFGNTQSS